MFRSFWFKKELRLELVFVILIDKCYLFVFRLFLKYDIFFGVLREFESLKLFFIYLGLFFSKRVSVFVLFFIFLVL